MASAENKLDSDDDFSYSSGTSEEPSDDSLPELIFYGKVPIPNKTKDARQESEKFVCKPVDKLYLCEKTRPLWMYDSDDEAERAKEYPILPFSKESMENYKRLRSKWKPKLTAEEQKTLFGTENAFKSFEEEGLTVLCKTCNPKITPVVKLPENYRKSMITKLKFLTLIKESSRRERDRKAVIQLREKARQPKNVLKNIIDEAIKELKEDATLDERIVNKLEFGQSPRLYKTDAQIGTSEDRDVSDLTELLTPKETVKMKITGTTKKLLLTRKSMKKTYLKPEKTEKYPKARFQKGQRKSLNLLEKLDKNDLKELKAYFYPKNCDYKNTVLSCGLENTRHYTGIPLRKHEFMKAVENVIGVEEYTDAAEKLFDSLEAKQTIDGKFMWWEQFLDIIISSAEPLSTKSYSVNVEEVKTEFQPFSKSPIMKVISAMCLGKCVYFALARLGEVTVMEENLKAQYTYKVPFKNNKSRNSCWVTDACYSLETETLLIVSSARCLHLYNTSRVVHKLAQTLTGMLEIPECLYFTTLKLNEALLLIGDNKGSIISINFKQTNKSFFKITPYKDGSQLCYWQDVIDESDWAEIVVTKNVHDDVVTQVVYIINSDSIISCSTDIRRSLVIRQRQHDGTNYVFKVEKGVQGFSIDHDLGLIATTSGDSMVSLWDPVNTRKPVGYLRGHNAAVLDVILISMRRVAVTYAEDKVLKLWNTESFTCSQTIPLKFQPIPFTRHVILNNHAIHTDYQIYKKSPMTSSASEMTNTEENSYKDDKILKHIFIVNLNNIKMLRLDERPQEYSDNVSDEKISNVSPADETKSEETTIDREILDFIENKLISNVNESDGHGVFSEIEYLEDFIKEGTPYLALKLHEPLPIDPR